MLLCAVAETYATTKAVEATYITADEAVLLNKAAKDEVATALEDLAEKDVVVRRAAWAVAHLFFLARELLSQ